MVTTIEHRQAATLAILADARGPLTPRDVCAKLRALGHAVEPSQARTALLALESHGYAESFRLEPIAGAYPSRIFWPTTSGREYAASLEAQRIDGV